MKKILLSLMLVIAACATALAAEVTFDFKGLYGTKTIDKINGADNAKTVGGVTFTATAGDNKNGVAYNKAGEIRMYAGNTETAGNYITFTSTEGAITKIVLAPGSTCTWGLLKSDAGTVTIADDHTATWEAGSAPVSEVTIGSYCNDGQTSSQYRIASAIVTVDNGVETVAKPVITPNGGKFDVSEAPVHVTIACDTEGAAISYAFAADGEFTAYSEGGFDVSEDCTVYAKATKGELVSDVASASFSFASKSVANIAAFYNKAKGDEVEFVNPVTVYYANGSNVLVADGTGYMLIYGSLTASDLTNGTVLKGLKGTAGAYGGVAQLTGASFTESENGTALVPEEVTVAGLGDVNPYPYHFVKLTNVGFTLDEGKTKNYTLTDGDATFAAYDQFKANLNASNAVVITPDASKKYDIVGVTGEFNGTKQFQFFSFDENVPAGTVATPTITPNGGTFYRGLDAPVHVTISCATEGAVITYALEDGGAHLAYHEGGFDISESCTVYAVATLGDKTSAMATAEFVIEDLPGIDNISAFYELETGAAASFKSPMTVVYQNGKNLITMDATGYMLTFGSLGKTYNQGDVIPAGVKGTVAEYNGNKQLTPDVASFADATETQTVTPTLIEAGDLETLVPYPYHFVTLKNVNITSASARNYTISDASGECAGYDQYYINYDSTNKVNIVEPDASKKYDVVGIASAYNGAKQILLISYTEAGATGVDAVNAAATTVVAEYGTINITTPAAARALVVNVAGQVVVDKAVAAGSTTLNINPGFYIVKVGAKVVKVYVK